MALRFSVGRFVNPLFKHLLQVKPVLPLVRHRSHFTPIAGWLEKPRSLLFHPKNIRKHTEVIPIAIITLAGFSCEVLWTIRLAFTRDDVRFLNKKMACEQIETRVGPMYPAPIRKFRVYNQKYETPQGLITATQTPVEEETN